MSRDVKQNSLGLAFGAHHAPVDAPRKLVLACLNHDDKAVSIALCVAMKAGKRKQAFIAASIGKSDSYVSLLMSGKRRITKALLRPLCGATGSNLVRQVWEALTAMNADDDMREIERMAAMLREAA